MAEAYRSQTDLNQRLDSTICFWEDEPYYVRTHGHRYPNIGLYKLGTTMYKPTKEIDHTDDKFSDRSPKLGYMNYNGKAYYVSRMPYRFTNQGLNHRSIVSTCESIPRGDPSWFTGESMLNCIKGIYPSVASARRKMASGEATSVAIHRHLAFKQLDRRILTLCYRDRVAAIWNATTEQWDYQTSPDMHLIKKAIDRTGLI